MKGLKNMSPMDHLNQENIFPMAILLGRRERIVRLIKMVSQSYDSILVIESFAKVKRPLIWLSPQLVIITDSFPGGLDPGLVDLVKKKLNPDKLICLASDISPWMEIELRSAGLIFLGSYKEFLNYYMA